VPEEIVAILIDGEVVTAPIVRPSVGCQSARAACRRTAVRQRRDRVVDEQEQLAISSRDEPASG
jgi:hypothetical protein